MSTSLSQTITDQLLEQFSAVRTRTERLCDPLSIEDYVVTAMEDASPAKWHLAHTTWFFETFVLSQFAEGYQVYDPAFLYLFNSYYVQAGERHCRAQRGLVTRPTVAEVYEYRRVVNEAMQTLLVRMTDSNPDLVKVVTIGLQHEQQHQELLLTDLKYLFYANPIKPAYDTSPIVGAVPTIDDTQLRTQLRTQHRTLDQWNEARSETAWIEIAAGIGEFGHVGKGFSYDNESPRHPRYLTPARVSTHLVTNAEYLEFMEDGGYERPELWLSAGWAIAQERTWEAPFYWDRDPNSTVSWHNFTLAGPQPLRPNDPVCHVSFYEADAYARWCNTKHPGVRLPTEFEWEEVAPTPDDQYNPLYANAEHGARDPNGWYGAVWQWTASPYIGYPGYRPEPGAIGEYNGKFMADQWVLRGSSIATPPGHARRTYRNFFPADTRWQFTGIRLASDL